MRRPRCPCQDPRCLRRGKRSRYTSSPMTRCAFFALLCFTAAAPAAAQTAHRARLEGDWLARAGDELRHIMVRSDSSAQFGDQVAWWRGVGISLWITLGDGVWQVYGMALRSDHFSLDAAATEKPVTLK